MTRFVPIFVFMLLGTLPVYGQDLSETLAEVGELYARAYVDPLAEALGADLNSGLFHTASTGKKILGVNVYVGFKASGALLQNRHKTFDLSYETRVPIDFIIAGDVVNLDVPATFTVTNAPTIFGNETPASAIVRAQHDTTFQTLGLTLPVSIDSTLAPEETIGGLFPTSIAPFIVPQIGVGTIMGTDIMIRWLPQIDVAQIGSIGVTRFELEIFGFGVRHNINQYLPQIPVDLAIQAVWQRVTADDQTNRIVDARVFAVNLAASKQFGVLTLYAGLQTERSDIAFQYTADPSDFDINEEPVDIDFTLRNIGKSRALFGLGLKLGPVLLNGDISAGQTTVVSAGFGFAF